MVKTDIPELCIKILERGKTGSLIRLKFDFNGHSHKEKGDDCYIAFGKLVRVKHESDIEYSCDPDDTSDLRAYYERVVASILMKIDLFEEEMVTVDE